MTIESIKRLGKDDKLIISLRGNVEPHELDVMCNEVETFLKSKRFLIVDSRADIYIIEKGTKVLLKDYLELGATE